VFPMLLYCREYGLPVIRPGQSALGTGGWSKLCPLDTRFVAHRFPGLAGHDPKLTPMKVSYAEEKSQIGVLLIIDTRNDR
jgi:hypothetical protein